MKRPAFIQPAGCVLFGLLLCLSVVAGRPGEAQAAATSAAVSESPVLPTAIVVEDRVALRAEPRESARQHALLWQGDSLQIRGRRLDFYQVYDYRRERAGYVRANQLRIIDLRPEAANDLLAVVRFLSDSPGGESLGVAYAAAYLRAAPARDIGSEVLSLLGRFADRLAHRVSSARRSNDQALAAHLEAVAHYGVRIASFERAGRMQLCYDGEAYRRVLALPASAEQQVEAALALTRPECVNPDLTPLERHLHDDWRAQVLDRVAETELPEHLRNRLRMRKAAVWSSVAFQRSRRGEPTVEAADRARAALAAVDRRNLAEEDRADYEEAAVRVGASRWAGDLASVADQRLNLQLQPGKQPGQTCVQLRKSSVKDGQVGAAQASAAAAMAAPSATLLAERCTFATVWANSVRVNPAGTVLALAVQPIDGWRELWLFQQGKQGWQIDVLPPAAETPDVGYIEFAGWVPKSRKLLTAREVRESGRWVRRYELRSLDSLNAEKQADDPTHLSVFYRNQDLAWKRQTLALR